MCPYLRALPPFLFHGPVHDGVRSVDEPAVIVNNHLLTVSDEVSGLAVRRAGVIGPLARADVQTTSDIRARDLEHRHRSSGPL